MEEIREQRKLPTTREIILEYLETNPVLSKETQSTLEVYFCHCKISDFYLTCLRSPNNKIKEASAEYTKQEKIIYNLEQEEPIKTLAMEAKAWWLNIRIARYYKKQDNKYPKLESVNTKKKKGSKIKLWLQEFFGDLHGIEKFHVLVGLFFLCLLLIGIGACCAEQAFPQIEEAQSVATYKISYTKAVIKNNSVGNEFSGYLTYDKADVYNDTYIEVPSNKRSFKLKVIAIEYDDGSSDKGSKSIRFNSLQPGETQTKTIKVTIRENGGRYKGNTATMKFEITIKRIK